MEDQKPHRFAYFSHAARRILLVIHGPGFLSELLAMLLNFADSRPELYSSSGPFVCGIGVADKPSAIRSKSAHRLCPVDSSKA